NLLWSCRVVLEPAYVWVSWRCNRSGNLAVENQGRNRSTVDPLVHFATSVGEGKTSGAIVVHARQIRKVIHGRIAGVIYGHINEVGFVAGTFVNSGILAAIRPEWPLDEVVVDIPITYIAGTEIHVGQGPGVVV